MSRCGDAGNLRSHLNFADMCYLTRVKLYFFLKVSVLSICPFSGSLAKDADFSRSVLFASMCWYSQVAASSVPSLENMRQKEKPGTNNHDITWVFMSLITLPFSLYLSESSYVGFT